MSFAQIHVDRFGLFFKSFLLFCSRIRVDYQATTIDFWRLW